MTVFLYVVGILLGTVVKYALALIMTGVVVFLFFW